MRILCQNYEFPPIGGGGAPVSKHLAEALCRRGHTVEVVTSGMSDLPRFEQAGRLTVRRVKVLRRHRHMANVLELASYVYPAYRTALAAHQRQPFDINHTHFAFPSGVAAYALKRKTGLPYVLTLHGSDVPGYNPDRFRLAHLLATPLWRRVVHEAEMVVSPSSYLKELFRRHSDVPVQVIPNGYHTTAEAPSPSAKKNRILAVSRLFRRKGIQYLLQALEGWDCSWEIVVVGDGPYLDKLRQAARGLSAKVNFTGYRQGEELQDLYASAKIFVFPSLQENFPNVLMEAMDAGCAIITTQADGCAEVVADAGIGVAPGSAAEIRRALQRLMTNPLEIQRLAARSRRRIAQLAWATIAKQYERCLIDATHSSAAANATYHPARAVQGANWGRR